MTQTDVDVSEVGVNVGELIGMLQAFSDDLGLAGSIEAIRRAADHLYLGLESLIAKPGAEL